MGPRPSAAPGDTNTAVMDHLPVTAAMAQSHFGSPYPMCDLIVMFCFGNAVLIELRYVMKEWRHWVMLIRLGKQHKTIRQSAEDVCINVMPGDRENV